MVTAVQNTNATCSNAYGKYNTAPARTKKQTSGIFAKNNKLNNPDNDDSLQLN